MSHCDKINKNLDKAVTSIRKKKTYTEQNKQD